MKPPLDPRLVRRARATRVYLLAGVAAGTATAVLVLLQADTLARSIAGVFDRGTLDGVPVALGALAAILLGRAALSWLTAWLAQRTAAAVKSQLRQDVMTARLASPAQAASTSSTLVTLVTQGLDALDGYFSKYLPQLLLAVTVPVVLGVAILVRDLSSALIIAVTIPFIPLLMALVGIKTSEALEKRWAFQSRLANHFADLVAGLPTLQVFSRAQAQAKGLRRTEAANRGATMGILRIAFLSALVLELFSTLAVAVVAVTIGARLANGSMGLETALFVLILAPEVYLPIRQVGVHFHDSADGLAAAEAAFAEIDAATPARPGDAATPVRPGDAANPVRPGDAATPVRPGASVNPARPGDAVSPASSGDVAPVARPGSATIHARELTFTYPGTDHPALAPIDLTVAPGEIVALTGRSGGGKTTLLNLILGFLAPTGGELSLGGRDSSAVDLAAWRRLVAYVPQTPGLIEGAVADNVRLGWPAATDADLRAVLDRAGAGHLDLTRPISDTGEGLSVGERRRVGIARALLRIDHGATLLLLDEPTAGLDTDTEATVLTSLRASGAAALVVSHRRAVVDASDRVVEVTAPRPTSAVGAAVAPSSPSPTAGDEGAEEQAKPARPKGFFVDFSDPTAKPKVDLLPDVDPAPEEQLATGRSPLLRLVSSLLNAIPKGKSRLLAAILLATGASGSAVTLMAISAWLISRAAEQPNFLQLTVAAVGVRLFAIARAVFRYVERLVGHDLALRLQSALRLRTYANLARTTLLGRARGDLLVRIVADVSAIEDVVVRIVLPFASAAVVVLMAWGLLSVWCWPAALVLLASAILGGLVVPWLTQRVSLRADQASVPLRGELGTLVHSLARTAPDLAAYGAAAGALDDLREADAKLRRVQAKTAFAQGMGAGLQVLAAGLAVIGGLWFAAQASVAGDLNHTMIAVFVLTPLALHEVFNNFAQAAQTQTRASAALDRVTAILAAPPVGRGDAPRSPLAGDAKLALHDVAVGWPGHDPVVAGVDLDLGPGGSLAVIGPSGVGKTTLAATVMGLIPAKSGEVEVSGRIGYLAQDAHIFATTVAENVRIGNKDATDDEVAAALAEAGLPGLDPARLVGEFGSTLSGGEARRLALARLFVGDYDLLILDEPTEHLDRETADALMDDIWAHLAERPVLVVSHDESLAARCDAVVDLGAGSLPSLNYNG